MDPRSLRPLHPIQRIVKRMHHLWLLLKLEIHHLKMTSVTIIRVFTVMSPVPQSIHHHSLLSRLDTVNHHLNHCYARSCNGFLILEAKTLFLLFHQHWKTMAPALRSVVDFIGLSEENADSLGFQDNRGFKRLGSSHKQSILILQVLINDYIDREGETQSDILELLAQKCTKGYRVRLIKEQR